MTEQMKQAMHKEECRIDIPIPDGLDKKSFMTGRYLGFCYGVNWYCNNVWHTGDEEPKDNSKCIVCWFRDETKTIFTFEYHSCDRYFHVTGPLGVEHTIGLGCPGLRWAYPEDLLPNK